MLKFSFVSMLRLNSARNKRRFKRCLYEENFTGSSLSWRIFFPSVTLKELHLRQCVVDLASWLGTTKLYLESRCATFLGRYRPQNWTMVNGASGSLAQVALCTLLRVVSFPVCFFHPRELQFSPNVSAATVRRDILRVSLLLFLLSQM